eukprot:4424603-Prymnesium_polylepis.1
MARRGAAQRGVVCGAAVRRCGVAWRGMTRRGAAQRGVVCGGAVVRWCGGAVVPVSYTHLRAHETLMNL